MKLNPTSRNLIGKLIIYNKPVFRIGSIVKNLEKFTQFLENESKLIFSEPNIEEKSPNTVLGKFSNTIKYNFVGYEKEKDFIEKFHVGIGENGYYYDMFLKLNSESGNKSNYDRDKILNEIKKIEENLYKVFENTPNEYIRESITSEPLEISNVIFNVVFSKDISNLFNNKLNIAVSSAVNKSESIVPGISNDFGILVSFNIHPNPNEYSGIDMEKVVVPGRTITIRQEPIPEINLYYIRFRGIPANESLDFLETISKIIET